MGKSLEIWNQQYVFYPLFVSSSYGYSSNEVSYSSPYGYSASVTPQQTMAYDISADYVDSTTYEPRSTMMDPEFISHGSINTRTLTVHFIYTQTSLWNPLIIMITIIQPSQFDTNRDKSKL